MSAEQEKKNRLIEKLKRELGEVILSGLSDPNVIEVMLNPDGCVWLDTLNDGMFKVDECIEPSRAFNIMNTVAALQNKIINEHHVEIECVLPLDGSRFTGQIPPIVDHPKFNIRKKALKVMTLDDYVSDRILTLNQANILRDAIQKNLSILIVGGTGTGKTTFGNALLHEMVLLGSPNQRFIIIEDKQELQCTALNKVVMITNATFTHQHALRHALVSRPDKICVGECRGGEVLTLIKAWNTGVKGGIATLHCNGAQEAALLRIEGMIEENAGIRAQARMIVESINIICLMTFDERTRTRCVKEVVRLVDYQNGKYVFEILD